MTDLEDVPCEESRARLGDGVADIVRDADHTRIVLEGDIDVHSVARLRPFVESECDRNAQTVVLDLTAVEFVDSHGLHLVAETHRRLANDGRSLVVVPAPSAAWRAFVVTGLDHVLVVEPDA